MRLLLLILIINLLGCRNESKNKLFLKDHVWINQNLGFDTIYADGDSTMYSIYGSGTLLLLDTNHTIKSFSNTFIKYNDSIAWGEPGIILTIGNWQNEGTKIIARHKLIEKTFILPTDRMDDILIDTFELKTDTLIRNKKETFVQTKTLTVELNKFLHSDWSKLARKKT